MMFHVRVLDNLNVLFKEGAVDEDKINKIKSGWSNQRRDFGVLCVVMYTLG